MALCFCAGACSRYSDLQEPSGGTPEAGLHVDADGDDRHDVDSHGDGEPDGCVDGDDGWEIGDYGDLGWDAGEYEEPGGDEDGGDDAGPGEDAGADGDGDVDVAPLGGLLEWAVQAGGTNPGDIGYSIAVLEDGATFVTGEFMAEATFGSGEENETVLVAAGYTPEEDDPEYRDVFVARYHPDGTLAWAVRAGGRRTDVGRGIAVLADGSTLVTGHSREDAAFGQGEPNETTLAAPGVFVARYNPDGALDWVVGTESPEPASHLGLAIAALPDGSSLVTGNFTGSITFGSGQACETTLTATGWYDVFVARFDAGGELEWARHAVGAIDGIRDESTSIDVLSDGSFVTTGWFEFTATFGPGEENETTLETVGQWEMFITRHDPEGRLIWVGRGLGDSYPSFSKGLGISALPDGSSLVTGPFAGTVVFGSGESNETTLYSDPEYHYPGGHDFGSFVARYEPDGGLAWARKLGESDSSVASHGISALDDGSFVVIGSFEHTATFGLGETNETTLWSSSEHGYNIFTASHRSDGSLVWIRQAGGPLHSVSGRGIAVLQDGSSTVTGSFMGEAVFGPGEENETVLSSPREHDIEIFVMRLGP